jgi:AcrR family transcriptional regulator
MTEPLHRGAEGRAARSRATVLAEAYRLLAEGGIGGVSIDEIARRTGVAKTTIYRHWPSRAALLLDACSQLGAPAVVPDTGSLRGDLTALVTALAAELSSPGWPAVLPSIIDAAERDPELAALHAALHARLMEPLLVVAKRAKERGELPGRRPEDVVAAVAGPLFYRRWFSKEPLDARFAAAVIRANAPTRPVRRRPR